MKTPREVLLSRHRQIQPRLDSLRRQVVSQISGSSAQPPHRSDIGSNRSPGLSIHMLGLLRWHLVGLSGIWMLIAALRVSGGGPGLTPPVAENRVVSHSVIFSLRENRRQIIESDNDSNPAAPERGKALPQSRHSRLWLNQA